MQVQRLQIIRCQDSMYPRDSHGRVFVDLFYSSMRYRRTDDIHVQHAREFNVIAILAFALDKACVFFSETGITHPL
jgi:zona occludens toxin (predicted ATPase)